MLLGACLQTENSSSGDGPAPEGNLEFLAANEVLLNNCTGCHIYHTQTQQELIDDGLVIPGDINNSRLYYRIVGSLGPNGTKNMPISGAAELQILADWITNIP